MRFVLRGREPRWVLPAAVTSAVLLTVLLTAIPIRLAGANPRAAFERYLITPLSTVPGLYEVLLTATPLIFTGLAVAIAFRAGYWNIGAEGQFLIGAVGVTWVGLTFPGLPAWAALPLGLIAGIVGGIVWSLVPAALKRRGGIDEVVTTLLLNPVALLVVQGLLAGPWRNSTSGFADSDTLGPGFTLPPIVPGTRLHWGFTVAVIGIAIAWFVMARTATGLRIKATGQSPQAASFSGIEVDRLKWRCALVSGAVAGLGGASQVMGVQHQLTDGISNSYGYTGIIVATVAGLSIGGVLLVAVLFGDIAVGAQNVSLVLQVPVQLGEILRALLMVTVLAAFAWRGYKLQWRRPRRHDALSDPPDPSGRPMSETATPTGVRRDATSSRRHGS